MRLFNFLISILFLYYFRALKMDVNYAPAFNGRGLVYDKIGEFE